MTAAGVSSLCAAGRFEQISKFVLLFLNLPIDINLPNLVANITLKIALPDTDVIKLDLGS